MPSSSTESPRRSPSKRKAVDENHYKMRDTQSQIRRMGMKRSKTPMFRDPLASSKLEVIKNIRAKRAAAETNITEAVKQARFTCWSFLAAFFHFFFNFGALILQNEVKQAARLTCCTTFTANEELCICRLLIAEAEKAAKALEVAAVRSPIARVSLVETRILIAEAIQLIKSIDRGITSPIETGSIMSSQGVLLPQHHSHPLSGLTHHIGAERKVNGSANQLQTPSGETNMFNFGHPPSFNQLGLEDKVEGLMEDAHQYTGPNGLLICKGDPLSYGSETNLNTPEEDLPIKPTITVIKKWVTGRLVEETD